MTSEELLELQKETAETVAEYLNNLIPGLNNVSAELKGDMKEDTWEYLRMILDGFNWVVEAFNGIVDYIDKDKTVFNIKEIDGNVEKLSKAYLDRNGEKIAESIDNDIIPFLEKVKSTIA